MIKILRGSLIVVMILSILLNVLLFSSIAYLDSEWEHTYNQKEAEWCEFSNDLIDYGNNLLYNLQEYSSEYTEIGEIISIDCWGIDIEEEEDE